jgi:hypothetical protein
VCGTRDDGELAAVTALGMTAYCHCCSNTSQLASARLLSKLFWLSAQHVRVPETGVSHSLQSSG